MFNQKNEKKMIQLTILLIFAFALAACGGASSDTSETASDIVDVQITLTEYGVESSVNVFEVGVPYHFTVVNEGEEEHEIMVMPPMSTDEMMGMMGEDGDSHDEGEAHEDGDSHDEGETHEDGDSHEEGEGEHSHDVLMENGTVLAFIDEHDLQAGATATFDYTFTEPLGFGAIEFACHLEGHYEEGMFLPILVQ